MKCKYCSGELQGGFDYPERCMACDDLRNQFAAAALKNLTSLLNSAGISVCDAAQQAFLYADAMMYERSS